MAYLLDQLENDLLACLCRLLMEEGRPVCACHHYAGEARPPADRCGTDGAANGMAWLRRDSSEFVLRAESLTWSGGSCSGSEWQVTLELGVRRCIKALPQGDNPPHPDLYTQDRELLTADYHTLMRVLCCDVFVGDNDHGFTVEGGSVEPLGPQGACSGNVLTLTLSGDPQATDDPEIEAMVTGAAADPTGYTAQVSWATPPVYVSGPAGAE
jgi:hypothetical protein